MNGKGGFGMSEKRFKMGESDIQGEMIFIDTQTNKIYWQEYFDEIVDLLNELSTNCSQLQEKNKQLKCINDQLEERLESSGIGVALKMDCDENE